MLEDMKQILDIIMQYKGELEVPFEDTLILAACKGITNKYILLIPNERNHNYVSIISNIENSRIINECDVKSDSFELFHVIKNYNTTEEVIDYIRKNSIIVANDVDVLKEFYQLMRIQDELIGEYGKRHLTRRIFDFNNWRNAAKIMRSVHSYWETETYEDKFQITNLTFASLVVVSMIHVDDIYLPNRGVHDRGPLDKDDFYNDMFEQLMDNAKDNKLLKDKKISVDKCRVMLKADDVVEYFGLESLSSFYHGEKMEFNCTEKIRNNKVLWHFTVRFEPKEFINRLILQYS